MGCRHEGYDSPGLRESTTRKASTSTYCHRSRAVSGSNPCRFFLDLQNVYIAGVLYSVVLPCLKIAILLEWMEMFTVTRNVFWWICVFLIFLQTTFSIVIIVMLNLVCIPNASIYDLTVAGECNLDKHAMELASASLHLFTDVVMLFLPQKVIWGLNMSVKKKLGVAGVFGLGVL